MTEIFQELTPAFDRAELMRYLGYPRSRAPCHDLMLRVERVVAQGIALLEPRGIYSTHSVAARSPFRLTLDGLTIEGRVAEYLGSCDRIAAFVVTVGDGIARLSAELCGAGDALDGWICDAVGSWAAEAAAEALMACLKTRLDVGEGLTLRYSPGYCGMEMNQQAPLFALTHPETIGVSLLPSQFMHPSKSISGLVGIGRAAVERNGSPCDHCSQRGCRMRRGRGRSVDRPDPHASL